MPILQPGKAMVLGCTVAGADMTRRVKTIQVFETLCKPYLTVKLVIQDDNNIMSNMQIQGGEPVTVAFSGGDGSGPYRCTTFIHSMNGEPSQQNLRTVIYTINALGIQYFGDKANMVQQSFNKATGTSIIQQIHDKHLGEPLSVLVPSSGLIGKDKQNYIPGGSPKPFKAINDIRKMLNFDAYQTGNTLYWRDKDGNKFAPMEHLFRTLSSQVDFEQRNTWGSDWRNVYGAYNAILEAAAMVNEAGKSGSRGVSAVASAASSERKVQDIHGNKRTIDQMMSSAGGAAGIIKSVAGGHGGAHNYSFFDSTQWDKANLRQTDKARSYAAQIANGPQLTLKVPIQTGLLCTVGKGVNAKLIPPTGDLNSGTDRASGLMLVVDLMHEVHGDGSELSGTTTMRCAKGGYG